MSQSSAARCSNLWRRPCDGSHVQFISDGGQSGDVIAINHSIETWCLPCRIQNKASNRNPTGKTELFVGLHVMLPSHFVRRKLKLTRGETTIPLTLLAWDGKQPRSDALGAPLVFSTRPAFLFVLRFIQLCGHVSTPSVYSTKSDRFSAAIHIASN